VGGKFCSKERETCVRYTKGLGRKEKKNRHDRLSCKGKKEKQLLGKRKMKRGEVFCGGAS